jgi:hypothetical protein
MRLFKMKKLLLLSFLGVLCFSGCAYDRAYMYYSNAQADIAKASGPMITFHENGGIKEIGNPMLAMAMMQMKSPKSEAAEFFDWLKMATPFGAIWGIVGAMSTANHGATTNVSGSGNVTGNSTGVGSTLQTQSPPTTNNITNELPPFVIAE